jgi:hypothetical protein
MLLKPAFPRTSVDCMKRALLLAAAAILLGGCATHVSRSKQQQVDLVTQTGIYSYQRALGPPR